MARKNNIDGKVAELGDLTREQLVGDWKKNYGVDPPTGARRELLIRALAWQIQEKQFGGLSTEAKRLLKSAMRRTASELNSLQAALGSANAPSAIVTAVSPSTRQSIMAGARLARDWNGKTHIVDVLDAGFLFEGKRYRSLSGIAKHITGATWSGPRFFGL